MHVEGWILRFAQDKGWKVESCLIAGTACLRRCVDEGVYPPKEPVLIGEGWRDHSMVLTGWSPGAGQSGRDSKIDFGLAG